jgi:hypothetical protein
MKTLKILDLVVAAVNIPDHKILAGDLGTIVEIYTKPVLAYEVEFVNADGSTTRALLTLAPDQIRQIALMDVLTTRQLPLAV